MQKIISPGEQLFEKPLDLEGTFVDDGRTYASVMGLVRDDRFVPLKGHYLPVPGDYVVGIVIVEKFSGYIVELHSPYEGNFSNRETREAFAVGDVISAKVAEVNEVHAATLVEPRKFSGGTILEVDYVKVPRIIGKNGSMLAMIRDFTGCDLFIGKNGRIYLRGGNTTLASMAIMKIDAEAHTPGLTDRMREFLEAATGKKASPESSV